MKKSINEKSVSAVSLLTSDGPTSVFVAGETDGRRENLLRRLQNRRRAKKYEEQRVRAMAQIEPQPHTIDDLERYIKVKYRAVLCPPESTRTKEGSRDMKNFLIRQEHPELLEQLGIVPPEKKRPKDMRDAKAVEEWLRYTEEYLDRIAALDETSVLMDYRRYEIRTEHNGMVEIELEKFHGLFHAGYQASPKSKSMVKKIWRDIYLYYGVTRKDIDTNSERYKTLVSVLAEQ